MKRDDKEKWLKWEFSIPAGAKNVHKCHFVSVAAESSVQHHEGEESRYGCWGEKEVRHEASTGCPSRNQENFFCQLYRYL